MREIRLHYLVGDVHLGGHDVYRVAENNRKLLKRAGIFDILTVCDDPELGDLSFLRPVFRRGFHGELRCIRV